jgi:hypothetical protein
LAGAPSSLASLFLFFVFVLLVLVVVLALTLIARRIVQQTWSWNALAVPETLKEASLLLLELVQLRLQPGRGRGREGD